MSPMAAGDFILGGGAQLGGAVKIALHNKKSLSRIFKKKTKLYFKNTQCSTLSNNNHQQTVTLGMRGSEQNGFRGLQNKTGAHTLT